jgi:hypothetical protein
VFFYGLIFTTFPKILLRVMGPKYRESFAFFVWSPNTKNWVEFKWIEFVFDVAGAYRNPLGGTSFFPLIKMDFLVI